MNDVQNFSEKLRKSLDGVLEDPEISFTEESVSNLLGFVVSRTFEGMDEGRRQEIVWERVLKDFSPDEFRRIEFLYTDAPSEVGP